MSQRLRVFLRNGTLIEMTVDHWEVRKSNVTGEITSLEWTFSEDGMRVPYLRAQAIDAVIVLGEGKETPGDKSNL